MIVNNQIATLRKEKGITQEDLASVLGVTNQAVSKWESSTCCPDIQLLPKIADYFGVTVDYLFDRNNIGQLKKLDKIDQATINLLAQERGIDRLSVIESICSIEKDMFEIYKNAIEVVANDGNKDISDKLLTVKTVCLTEMTLFDLFAISFVDFVKLKISHFLGDGIMAEYHQKIYGRENAIKYGKLLEELLKNKEI